MMASLKATFPAALHRKLERMAGEVAILGPRLFQLGDDLPEMVSSGISTFPDEASGSALVRTLGNALYLRYYCGLRKQVAPDKRGPDLLDALRQANSGREGWDAGWEIIKSDAEERVVVRSGDRTRLLPATDLLSTESRTGEAARVSIRRRREDAESQPGFYYAIGETLGDQYEDFVGARLYFNLRPAAASAWMAEVTRTLNRHRVPFQFKVLRHAAAFTRVDSGILYVPRRHAGFVAALVLDLARTLDGLLDPVPWFTCRLARGIALADNPPGGGSFGLNRMNIVAEGIVAAWMDSDSSVAGRLLAIGKRFRGAGIDPGQPWLNPGNTRVFVPDLPGRSHAESCAGSTPWLDVADRLGARLVRDAIRHRDRCTWLGWTSMEHAAGSRSAYCTVGGDLYSGASGIALFLARLSGATGDARQRAVAAAALRHTSDQTRHNGWQVGAYSGLAGVLHAAIAVAESCDSDEAATMVSAVVDRLAACQPPRIEIDILGGRAGAVRSLLQVAARGLDHSGLALQVAERFCRELIQLAEQHDGCMSWATTKSPISAHLLGYSHGTAGIACALEEAAHVLADKGLREAARSAWRYEASRFDAVERNWPDFRLEGHSPATAMPAQVRYSSWWCHGAPGTALALARSIALDPAVASQHDVCLAAAVSTTMANLDPAQGSFCLCHGIAGNADILLEIARLTDRSDLQPVVLAAAHAGTERYHESGAWPCGVPGGQEAPGLMLGLAGIGHFYLRLHDRSVPSALEL